MWGGLPSLTLLATLCPQAPAAGVGVAGGGARRARGGAGASGGGDERARRSGPGRAALEDSLRSSAPSARPSPRTSDQRKQADPAVRVSRGRRRSGASQELALGSFRSARVKHEGQAEREGRAENKAVASERER